MTFAEMSDRQLILTAQAMALEWMNETAQSPNMTGMIEELKARAEQPEEEE